MDHMRTPGAKNLETMDISDRLEMLSTIETPTEKELALMEDLLSECEYTDAKRPIAFLHTMNNREVKMLSKLTETFEKHIDPVDEVHLRNVSEMLENLYVGLALRKEELRNPKKNDPNILQLRTLAKDTIEEMIRRSRAT